MPTKNFKVRFKVPGQFIPDIIRHKYYNMKDGSIKQADIPIADKLLNQPNYWLSLNSKELFKFDLNDIMAFVDNPQKLRIRPITDSDILTDIFDYYIILDAHFLNIYGDRDVYSELLEVAETAIDPTHGEVIVCQACFITDVYNRNNCKYVNMSPLFIKPKQEN